MDILGFYFTDSQLWLLGIAGALISIWLAAYLQSAISRSHAAKAEFGSAFDGLILNLTENPNCPIAQIAHSERNAVLAAISKFRKYIPWWRRRSFERDVAKYKEAYEVATEGGSVFAIVLSESTDVARAKRAYFLGAVQNLASHAHK